MAKKKKLAVDSLASKILSESDKASIKEIMAAAMMENISVFLAAMNKPNHCINPDKNMFKRPA